MLSEIRIASPCSVDWDQMQGNDRVRHCAACNLNVYNLSALTEQEIRQLVAAREGRLCARMYRRRDGTVLTGDCPVGLKAAVRRLSRIAGAVLSVVMSGFAALPLAQTQSYTQTNMSDAAIQLKITDAQGAVIPDAEVVMNEGSSNLQLHGKTDRNGQVVLRGSRSGRYILKVSSPGFQTSTSTVELRSAQMLSLPVQLNVAAMTGVVVMIEPGSQPDKNVVPPTGAPMPVASAPRPMQQ